jgi:sugar lactone lactonase YvrE
MKPTHEGRPPRPEASGIRVLDAAYTAELLVPGTPLRGCCGMAFHDDGSILVGNVLSGRISRLDLSTGGVSTYIDFHRGVLGADDITSDGEGTCWTSCATGLGGESVFRIEKSGRARAIYSGIAGANGIQFNRKTGRLFVGQFLAGNGLYEIDPLGKAPARLITKAFASTNAMDFDREGNILVTVAGGRIARVNPDTGESALLDVCFPHNSALKVGAEGEIYVSGYSGGFGAVWRVSEDGRSMQPLSEGVLPPLDNLLWAPGNRLFVSSLRDASVIELDLSDGCKPLRHFSPLGAPGITSIAASAGELYVNDGLSVRRLDRGSNSLVLTAGSFFARNGFPLPGCLRGGPRGALYLTSSYQFPIANTSDGRLYVLNTDDFTFRKINSGTYQSIRMPSALWLTSEVAYVAEFLSGEIVSVRLDDDETRRAVVGTSLLGPLGVVRCGEALYVAESLGQRISVIDLGSGKQDVLVAAGIGRPTAMDADPGGHLLVIDANDKRLLKIDRDNGAMSVIADRLPIYPIIASNWPLVGVANGLAVDADGRIYLGGNEDGSVWCLRASH